MVNLGLAFVFALLAGLFLVGFLSWCWVIVQRLKGWPVYPPETRLVATWGFPELLLCIGCYVITVSVLSFALVQLGAAGRVAAAQTDAAPPHEAIDHATEMPASDPEALTDREALPAPENENDTTESAPEGEQQGQEPPVDLRRMAVLITGDGVSRLLTMFCVLLLMWLGDRKILLRFGWYLRPRDVLLGLIAAGMLLPPLFVFQAVLSQLVPYEHPVLDIIRDAGTPWIFAAMAFSTVIVAPLTEEFFFRGLLQGWLQRIATGRESFEQSERVPDTPALEVSDSRTELLEQPPPRGKVSGEEVSRWPYWPIFVSSVLFGLVHFGHGAAPIALFFLACGLGYLYRITGSLWPCVIVHMVLNAISTSLAILSVS